MYNKSTKGGVFTDGRIYAAIDLKSFYASVECIARGLDPLDANLVVADKSRTDKTICLAVSPSLKSFGIPGRPRLFEVVQRVNAENRKRRAFCKGGELEGRSCSLAELNKNPRLKIDYITAPPRMAAYLKASSEIYKVYLKYVAPEDIHVYSIDEVFMDITAYLRASKMSAREFVSAIVRDVLETTGITATAGIGTNLYLCKVAMDIVAKHIVPDQNGVRIASLDEMSYRKLLWAHRPITDFWRVGAGYAKKLEKIGVYTMGDIARCSLGGENEYLNEKLLYKLFGVNAQLLIDHAWGYEPCTIQQIKNYRPTENSISSGQVLTRPYEFYEARLVTKEMAELLSLDLVDKELVCDKVTLTIGYDVENITNPAIRNKYTGKIVVDGYGRKTPVHSHGTENLCMTASSARLICDAVMKLYDRITNKDLLIRRITITANRLVREDSVTPDKYSQLDLMSDNSDFSQYNQSSALEKEKRMQRAVIGIKKKYGKNSVLRGMNLLDGATAKERNAQIGGHRA